MSPDAIYSPNYMDFPIKANKLTASKATATSLQCNDMLSYLMNPTHTVVYFLPFAVT